MATKNKTAETNVSVIDFINSFVDKEEKRQDSFRLIELMREWSGFEPKMWGPTIIGFGSYHYKYASGHEGDSPLIGFSPRKAEFSIYVYSPTEKSKALLDELGKFRIGKVCIYVKKLSDINIETLEKLSKISIAKLQETNRKHSSKTKYEKTNCSNEYDT
jgi:Domain of unknown function (DU1801)